MQRARSSKYCAALGLGLALAASAACGSEQSRPASPSTQPGPAPEPEAAKAPAPESFDAPAELIPADALLVVTGESPAGVADAIEWESLRALEPLERAADAMKSEIGRDLLSPAKLAELGVATEEAFGLALVPGERPRALIVTKLASKSKFLDELEAIAKHRDRELERKERESATVLVFGEGESHSGPRGRDPRSRFVLRGDYLLVAAGRKLADRVSASPRPEALASEESAYRRAARAAGSTGEVFGFVDLAGFLEHHLTSPMGPPPGLGLVLDQIPFEGIGVSAEPRGDEIGLELALPARDDAPAPLLKSGEGPPAIVGALEKRPLALVSLNVDIDAAQKRVQQALGRGQLNRAKALAGQAFAIDIDEELWPLFTGEVGLAWSGSTAELFGEDSDIDELARKSFDLHATLGVRDTAGAAELMERVAESPLAETLVQPRDDGGITLDHPDLFKPLHIDVREGVVAATTEPAFLERLSGDAAASFASETERAHHGEIALREGAAAHGSIAAESIATWLLVGQSAPIGLAEPALSEPERGSAEYREKRRELEDVKAEIEEMRARVSERQRALGDVIRDYGVLTLSFDADPDLVRGEGGHFLAPGSSLASLIERSLAASAEVRRLRRELFELESRRRALFRELRELSAGP